MRLLVPIFNLVHAGALLYPYIRSSSSRMSHPILAQADCACDADQPDVDASALAPLSFDLTTATILAGYAFEAYNEPTLGKRALGADGTEVLFTSAEFIRQVFEGVLLVTVKQAKIKEGGAADQAFLDRIATGSLPDPYVSLRELDRVPETGPPRIIDRVVDSATTTTKLNTFEPDWQERFFLYVRNRRSAALNVTVHDKNIFSADSNLGYSHPILLSELQEAALQGQVVSLPIPLYLPKQRGWFDFFSPSSDIQKLVRTGTLALDLQFVPWERNNASEGRRGGSAPRGASAEADWRGLLERLLQSRTDDDAAAPINEDEQWRLRQLGLHQACSIDNEDTDTQGGVFLDIQNRRVVVSFRGTEQGRFKDILTDINFIQEPFYNDDNTLAPLMFHSGFLRAYCSVRSAVMQALEIVLSEHDGWCIFLTGHSLGGALATLLTFDLCMMRDNDPAVVNSTLPVPTQEFLSRLRDTPLQTYTFGAPRVGNKAFADKLQQLLEADRGVSLFRVVNKEDIVARLPRSSRINRLIEYEHAGSTVLVDDTPDESATRCLEDMIWIEGESAGVCPLLDISPFTATNQGTTVPTVSLQEGVSEAFSSLRASLLTAVPSAAIQAANVSALLDKYEEDLSEAALSLVDLEEAMASSRALVADVLGGVDPGFVDRELMLLRSIFEGRALEHHLEPSYFLALSNVIEARAASSAAPPAA